VTVTKFGVYVKFVKLCTNFKFNILRIALSCSNIALVNETIHFGVCLDFLVNIKDITPALKRSQSPRLATQTDRIVHRLKFAY
jgi:hypothetical protein